MKGRKQKISEDNYQRKNRAELEEYPGVQTFIGITENNLTNVDQSKYRLLEQILSSPNLNEAYKQVKGNNGSSGVDKMKVESLRCYLVTNQEGLIASIFDGKYRPNPVRRVEIPKGKGKKRQLGIPTVVDRVVQQAIQQILSPIYEQHFSSSSYGFRPKRSAHDALKASKSYITEGYTYAVDLDLEKFFDTVNQQKLIEILSRTIKDGRVISLIHKYLNAGALVDQKFEPTKVGVPQGGPLSPLLSNIMLHELDKELESRGHRFVRYADDLLIFCKSERSAKRTLTNMVKYIEEKLYLKVNKEKTKVAYVSKVRFLGYTFYKRSGAGRLRVDPTSITKLKERIKTLTSRSNGWGNTKRKKELRQYIIGWVNYFKLADMKTVLSSIDQWYRRRLRMVIWKQWRLIRTRGRNLIKLGVDKDQAWSYAKTRKGYWRTAGSSILGSSITNKSLKDAGYLFFLDYYHKVNID